ncbi:saoe class I histocompatibility antigen [Prionailurus iriomotensis]
MPRPLASREALHVFPLVSGCQAPKEGDPIVLACLARGYSRESVQVTSVSGKQDQAKKTNLFMPNAQDNIELSFLTAQWKPDPHQCSTASGKLQKAFQWPASWENKTPLSTLGPTPPEDSTTVPSTARVSVPSTSHTQEQTREPERTADGSLRECRNHTSPPSLYLPQPPLQGPWLKGQATFTCLAVGAGLQEARLSWEVAGAPLHAGVDSGPLEENANGSQSLRSRLDLPVASWASGANITCTLSGPDVASQVVSAAPKEHAASAPSSLTVHVLTVSRAASWLLCKVSGFSPPDVLLTWLRDQVQVDSASFATAPPAAELGSSTFETWSVLHIRTAPAPRPDTYTCVVRHEASRRLLNASWSPDTARPCAGLGGVGGRCHPCRAPKEQPFPTKTCPIAELRAGASPGEAGHPRHNPPRDI